MQELSFCNVQETSYSQKLNAKASCQNWIKSMSGFIAQLVEHRTGIAEVTGSNPVEALIFSGFLFPIA